LPRDTRELYSPIVNSTPQDDTAKPRRKGSLLWNRSRQRERSRQHGDGSRQRNRSRQRECMLEWLRETDSHPTATQIHSRLLAEMPSLSLGTVYRNLEVLVADGEIDEVASGVGAARYDGNPDPHHHFHCEDCGTIIDIDMSVPRGLEKKLAGDYGLVSNRVRMAFFGLCPECGPECEKRESEDLEFKDSS
jgi:Fur family peroxide stress response transcriptional regulator